MRRYLWNTHSHDEWRAGENVRGKGQVTLLYELKVLEDQGMQLSYFLTLYHAPNKNTHSMKLAWIKVLALAVGTNQI